jgi:hypothetical protein
MITSNNTPNYQVIAESMKGILFKNKRDRKILNVDPQVKELDRKSNLSNNTILNFFFHFQVFTRRQLNST